MIDIKDILYSLEGKEKRSDLIYESSFNLIPNFHTWELKCRGTGTYPPISCYFQVMTQAFRLQNMRDSYGFPIYTLSWYRDPVHNKSIGGSLQSKHMKGIATDVAMPRLSLKEIANYALMHGFTGIGIYKEEDFAHIDTRLEPLYWIQRKDERIYYKTWELHKFLDDLGDLK